MKQQQQQQKYIYSFSFIPPVLNKNTFSIRDEVFSQMSGVAMGTKMGPSYACLFMGHLEHTLLFRLHSPPPLCVCVCVYVVFPPLSSHPL